MLLERVSQKGEEQMEESTMKYRNQGGKISPII